MSERWQVYLGGEIHSDWRDRIRDAAREQNLPVDFMSPVTDHESSDRCGTAILGEEDSSFWTDHLGGSVNAIRTRTFIRRAGVVVIRFGEKYRQWTYESIAVEAWRVIQAFGTDRPPDSYRLATWMCKEGHLS